MRRALLILCVLIGCGKDAKKNEKAKDPEPTKPAPATVDPGPGDTAGAAGGSVESKEGSKQLAAIQQQMTDLDAQLDKAMNALANAKTAEEIQQLKAAIAALQQQKVALRDCLQNPLGCKAPTPTGMTPDDHAMISAEEVAELDDALAELAAEVDAINKEVDETTKALAEAKTAEDVAAQKKHLEDLQMQLAELSAKQAELQQKQQQQTK